MYRLVRSAEPVAGCDAEKEVTSKTEHIMTRHITLLGALVFSLALMAEAIPANYYDAIDGKQDSVLKSQLSLIVRGGDRYDYGVNTYHTSSNPPEWEKGDLKAYGTWQALPSTDMHPDGIVWDMYSHCVRYYPNKLGDSGCSLNIEHCLPKSWWGGDVNDAYKDLYHLNPSDQRANGQKSNYPPGHVVKGDKFDNGSFRMDSKNKSQYGFICFEPEAEYQGDFARAYFYIATAYEDFTWASGTTPFDAALAMDNDSYLEFKPWLIQVLLDWHRADPVSDKEICRADQISSIQHNRNPFIDYPELVEYIWGNKKGQAVNLDSLECEFEIGRCIDPITPEPSPILYDTLINLPATSKSNILAITGDISASVNSGVATNAYSGNSSCVMGTGATGGEITFTGIQLTDTAVLAFRASPYNSATSMQLDIYINDGLFQSILVAVEQDTRNEVRYRFTVPANTTSIKLVSVGTSTAQRACLQELYLLSPKGESTDITEVQPASAARKELRKGQVVIRREDNTYTTSGQNVR